MVKEKQIKYKSVTALILTLLLLVTIVIGVAGCSRTERITDEVAGGIQITPHTSSSIKITSTPVTTANEVSGYPASTTQVLTITPEPADATGITIDWSVAWDKETTISEYTEDTFYRDDAWYYDAEDSSEYTSADLDLYGISIGNWLTVTPSAGSALTATVECKQAFGCPIIVTAVCRENKNLTATCKVDYISRIIGIYTEASTLSLGKSNSNIQLPITALSSSGTIRPQIQVSVRVSVPLYADLADNFNIGTPPTAKFRLDEDYIYTSEFTSGYYFIALSCSTNWDTFCDTYILQQNSGITETQKQQNRNYARRLLEAIKNDPEEYLNQPYFRVYITVTDISGRRFSGVRDWRIGNLASIPTY